MADWRWALWPAGSLHGRLVHSRRVRALVTHFSELIPPGHTVLDVGCGDGLIDELIVKQRPDLQVAGVDVHVRPNARIAVTPFDGTSLPFGSGSWDTVMFCDVLHHTEDPVPLLRAAARVARQRVIIKDHIVEGRLARATLRLMDVVGNAPHGVRLTYNYLTPEQWDDAVRLGGLRLERMRRQLNLYPSWADKLFGRSLHFIAVYEIAGRTPDPPP